MQDDFSKFKPLSANGLKSFSTLREPSQTNGSPRKSAKPSTKRGADPDSDEDIDGNDDIATKAQQAEDNEANAMLSPDDARKQGELAEGVQKIRVRLPYPPSPTRLSPHRSAS